MSLHRRNPKRDANERAIVAALEAVGALVFRLSGSGVPDLLVAWRGRWTPLEVKTAKGTITAQQQGFHGLVPIVRSESDALKAIGAMR